MKKYLPYFIAVLIAVSFFTAYPDNTHAQRGAAVGQRCDTSTPCGEGLYCHPTNRTCAVAAQACQTSSDCPSGSLCSIATRTCYESGTSGNDSQGSSFPPSADNLFEVKDTILNLINGVFVPVLFAVAFAVFIYGVYKYFILGGASGDEKGEGKKLILYGLIGFAVMVSVWGLVNVVINTFGIDGTTRPDYPLL